MIEFIESPIFTKHIHKYLNEEEYSAFQWFLCLHPESGDLVKNSGGLRKIRWKSEGKGKSGGVRVVYYWLGKKGLIWLLTIYSKSEASTIPAHILKAIKKEFENE